MKKFFRQILNLFQTERIAVGTSALIGICIALLVYINFFQFPLFSKRNILIIVIISILSASFLFVFYKYWIGQIIKKLPKKKFISLILFSIILATFFSTVPAFNIKPLYFLYPRQTITIQFSINNTPDSATGVSLSYLHTDIRDISFSELKIKGDYKINKNGIYFPSGQKISINWQGISGNNLFISFLSTNFDQPVVISYKNGSQDQIQLNSKSESVSVHHLFPPPLREDLLTRILIFPVAFMISLVILLGFFSAIPYTFFMLSTWLIILFIYWPGIIGDVNIVAVNELFSGQLADWHPVVFTLLLGSVIKTFSTASVFLIIQILALSMGMGWAFASFEKNGVKRVYLWILTLITAFLPANLLSVITLTNDTAYSILLAAITMMIIKIVLSKGIWLEEKRNWIFFTLLSLFSILLRYNGIPAVGLTLLTLIVFFPGQRKSILYSSGLIIFIWGLINGPIFNQIGVNRVSEGHLDNIILHHLSAHVSGGTPLTLEEQNYLDSLYPLDNWDYSCCSNKAMWNKPDFNKDLFHKNSETNLRIAMDLFFKAPLLELNHMLCASDLVWNLRGDCTIEHTVISKNNDQYYWTQSYFPQYKEDSLLPWLVKPLSEFFIFIENSPLLSILFWRPALFLYFSIIFTVIFQIKTSSNKALVILAPIIGQSVFLFLFNRTQNFRYQYCAVLISLITFGLVLIPSMPFLNGKKDNLFKDETDQVNK